MVIKKKFQLIQFRRKLLQLEDRTSRIQDYESQNLFDSELKKFKMKTCFNGSP